MATGWGIKEVQDSQGVYVGTTAQDIQRIIASQYENAGILTGAKVVLRSDWQYQWTAGAVVMDLGSDLAVQVPVYEGTVAPDPAPATGERIDTIYVEQLNTASSNLARVVVTSGSAPANAVVLDKLRVPAGATKTSQCTSVWDRRYARHSQSTQGRISSAVDTSAAVRSTGTYKACNQRFYVDTDRTVNVKLSTTLVRLSKTGGALTSYASSWGTVDYKLFVDGVLVRTFPVLVSALTATQQVETLVDVPMGAHTAHVESSAASNGDLADLFWRVQHGGGSKWPGDALTVFDAGVAQ